MREKRGVNESGCIQIGSILGERFGGGHTWTGTDLTLWLGGDRREGDE
jgi:hypothetical protein